MPTGLFNWITRIAAIAAAGSVCAPPARSAEPEGVARFERTIRPLLIAHCAECHNEFEPENNLRLDTPDGIARGGDTGAVVVPGKPDRSLLIRAVRYTSKLKMPPDGKLPPQQIAALERWVKEGAVLPGAKIRVRQSTIQGGPRFTKEEKAWWSFQPIGDPQPPAVRNRNWVRTPLDQFILARLEARQLGPSPAADKRTLIRRVTFDLIGLPPTPTEVQEFVDDDRPDALVRLVDRLLASPHYGERWGRHWLDVARYADTNGGGFDYVYPHAWHYRDYVVRAFNADKPFDRFLIEQLAGDLLPVGDDSTAYLERLRATGFLTLAPKGLGMQDKEQMVLDVVDDQIDVLGRSVMGLTLACARCHAHKFDPIPTEDYYALAGIFKSTITVSQTDKNPSYWPERELELPSVTAARKTYQTAKAANQNKVAAARLKADAAIMTAARRRLPEYLFAALRLRQQQSSKQAMAVAHWPLDEGAGTSIGATVGPGGVLSNAESKSGPQPTWCDGRIGKALRFDGKKEVVSIGPQQLGAFDLGTGTDLTLSFWLRTAKGYSPNTADTLLAAVYPAGGFFVALRPGSFNGLYFRHHGGKGSADIKPASNQLEQLTDNRWHHVAFTSDRDGSGIVYRDGRRVGATSIAAASGSVNLSGIKSFVIGAAHNGFRGDLDDVALWKRLLAPSEIHNLYMQGVESNLNVAEVERLKVQQVESADDNEEDLDDDQLVNRGLVPSVVHRFVGLLNAADGQPKSPLYSLLLRRPASAAEVATLTGKAGQPLQQLLQDKKQTPFVSGQGIDRFYPEAVKRRLAELSEKARTIERSRVPAPTFAMIAQDAAKPADVRVHIRGNHKNLGERVSRRMPLILAGEQQRPIAGKQSGRLELARWLTSRTHPLTARVFVNRVWHWHFGAGLVRTPDNFGRLGEPPSHPELLDWLASRLIEDNWSIKKLHRRILLSATYSQSSEMRPRPFAVDSGNRLLWRMNRRRLDAESLRDAMLASSGTLERQLYGTVNRWKPKDFSVNDRNEQTANYQTNRRSLYLPVVRTAIHPMLQLFDFGDPNSVTARRTVTTVAPQALFMMNNPFVLEQAERFAERLASLPASKQEDRIRTAYQMCLSRDPTAAELKRAKEFLKQPAESQNAVWPMFCQSLFALNEFLYVD